MTNTYFQPFLQLTPPDEYPEVTQLVKYCFPGRKQPIRENLHALFCAFLYSPRVAVSRRRQWYQDNPGPTWYTMPNAVLAQDLLIDKGFATLQLGRQAYKGRPGRSSILSTTRKTERLIGQIVLKPVRTNRDRVDHIALERRLLDKGDIGKIDNEVLARGPHRRETLEEALRSASSLNRQYFSEMKIGFTAESGLDPGWTITVSEGRAITDNDQRTLLAMSTNVHFTRMFTLLGCGRFYQRSTSYQHLSKAIRTSLTLNGEPTCELDYRGMQVNLGYFLAGKSNVWGDDPYGPVLQALGQDPGNGLRDVIKRVTLVALNTPDYQTFVRAMNHNYRESHIWELGRNGISLEQAFSAVRQIHPELMREPGERLAHLSMYHESNIMQNVLDRLGEERIPALPLHDSVITPLRHRKAAASIMNQEYRTYTGESISVR